MDIVNFLNDEIQHYSNVVEKVQKAIELTNEQDLGALNYFKNQLKEVERIKGLSIVDLSIKGKEEITA